MSQEAPPYDASDAGAENMPSVGEMLIAARERWNYSAADMARQLRLALRQVEALEANRFEALPGNTFVRGFIRNYAKAVQEDPDLLLEAYENMRPNTTPTYVASHAEGIEFNQKPTPKWVWYAGAFVLLALALPLGIYFALHDEEVGGKTHLSPSAAALPPATPAPEIPGANPSQVQGQASVPSGASAVTATADLGIAAKPSSLDLSAAIPPASEASDKTTAQADAAAPLTTGNPTPAQAAKTQDGANGLILKFEGDAWVEIRDKKGRKIFSQLNRAGTEQALAAHGPVSLVVGNAAQVRIAYNGKPVDLTPYIKVNVARLTLE